MKRFALIAWFLLPAVALADDAPSRAEFVSAPGKAHQVVYVVDLHPRCAADWPTIRDGLLRSIARLNPRQSFCILAAGPEAPLADGNALAEATNDRKLAAAKFLADLKPASAEVDLPKAFERAFALLAATNKPDRLVYFLTDREPPDADGLLTRLGEWNAKKDVRIVVYYYDPLRRQPEALLRIAADHGGSFKNNWPLTPAQQLADKLGDAFQPCVEPVTGGEINWTRGELIAVGTGKAQGTSGQAVMMAKRAASLVAARNAILLMDGIRAGAGGGFRNVARGHIRVDAVLEDFRELSSTFDPRTRVATVRLAAPLYGARGVVELKGGLLTGDAGERAERLDAARGDAEVIVIDARGVGLAPSMLPKILSADGKALFAPGDLPAEALAARPVALFVYREQVGVRRETDAPILSPIARAKVVAAEAGRIDPELDKSVRAAFSRPLILTAGRAAENDPTSVVLTQSADKVLMLSGEWFELMKAGKLVIVTDVKSVKP
ncbi:MAG TPA: hypothetical protein DCX07_07765 [Phycisphaerales bacterium]|nr:hypothetical protein [Phycisphaerales bacterium]